MLEQYLHGKIICWKLKFRKIFFRNRIFFFGKVLLDVVSERYNSRIIFCGLLYALFTLVSSLVIVLIITVSPSAVPCNGRFRQKTFQNKYFSDKIISDVLRLRKITIQTVHDPKKYG